MENLQTSLTTTPHANADTAQKKDRTGKGRPAFVRLTEEEYHHLKNDSAVTGKSIPYLLKRAYFVGAPLVPLMRKDDLKMVMSQLSRIGSNVNQIARNLNSGFRAGFNDDLVEVRKMLTMLTTFVTSAYGSSKPQRKAD
jgi:hypothetical protein